MVHQVELWEPEMRNTLRQKIAQLESRERGILIFGLPVILLLAGYLFVAKPLSERHIQAEERLARAEALLESVIAQDQSSASCLTNSSLVDSSSTDIISTNAQRLGLAVTTSGSNEIEIDAARGDLLLAYAEELACAGLKIEHMEIQKSYVGEAAPDAYLAKIRFPSGVDTP